MHRRGYFNEYGHAVSTKSDDDQINGYGIVDDGRW